MLKLVSTFSDFSKDWNRACQLSGQIAECIMSEELEKYSHDPVFKGQILAEMPKKSKSKTTPGHLPGQGH